MGVQDALAAMLVCEAESALLREDPVRLQRRYELSDAELAMLSGAAPDGYRVTYTGVLGKLRSAVAACLPDTVAELLGGHRALWEEFARGVVRRPQPAARPFGMWESERLTAWLATQETPRLTAYARYELARATLVHDRDAALAARDAATVAGSGDRPAGALRLSAAARVETYTHDVTAGPPIGELPAGRTRVLLQRGWRAPVVRAYRISDGTAMLLARCDGTRDAAQVIAEVGGDHARAAETLAKLVLAGLVWPRS
ncbi:hypothetical protein OG339_13175 [Streptosporangium sp. NBC_01495]|uniref:hypothetical protein n=1 Tax=Streptosporangium sp. NBC_01495 TaxID=2903899 RepID=UPI002E321242|nr:hypothetical protein [Streptosporangium sp. NBC_01495]